MKGERQVDMRPVCIALGYLYGSFLTADLVVRAKTGKHRWDSFGNPGTANVASRLGTRYGIIILCGDILKTVLACICGLLLLPGPERLGILYAGFGAVIGHCWPVWKGFRGGKGIACAGTAAVLFSPAIGFGALIGGAAAVLVSGYLALGSAAIAALLPALALLSGRGTQPTAVLAAAGIILLLRHRKNFVQIANGGELCRNFFLLLKNKSD